MALYQPRMDLYSPCVAKTFATLTAAVLHQDVNSGGAAPSGINHLPCRVIFHGTGNFSWKDIYGTTHVTPVGTGTNFPVAVAEITSASVPACTVLWQPSP